MTQNSVSSVFIIQNSLIASRLSRKVGNRLSVHGLSLTEYLVMDYLSSCPHKEVSRIELAEHLGMSASGVTRLLMPMEKNRIVKKIKNPRDARQSLAKLSDTGQRVLDEASVSFAHIASDLTSQLSPNQQEKLIELYKKVI